jgi:hypothetical protein
MIITWRSPVGPLEDPSVHHHPDPLMQQIPPVILFCGYGQYKSSPVDLSCYVTIAMSCSAVRVTPNFYGLASFCTVILFILALPVPATGSLPRSDYPSGYISSIPARSPPSLDFTSQPALTVRCNTTCLQTGQSPASSNKCASQ